MRQAGGKAVTLKSGEQAYVHQVDGVAAPPAVEERQRPEPVINVGALMDTWHRRTPVQWVKVLAQRLGVSAMALAALNAAWASPHRAWAFPMRDGYGNYTGIRLRNMSGDKWAVRGSHQGIFYPVDDNAELAIICEGPTDTAAALSLGFYAVGRPSCSGGMADVLILFRRLGVRKAAIVADNDDRVERERGFNPGINGAMMLAKHLTVPSCTLILPCKDIREFLRLGGNHVTLQAIIDSMVWRQHE